LTFTFLIPKFHVIFGYSNSYPFSGISTMAFRHRLEYLGVRLVAWISRLLPLGLAIALGRGLGWFVYAVLWIRRSVTLDNLRQAYPEQSEAWIRNTAKKCYCHFGRVAIEMARLPKMDTAWIEKHVEFQGKDILDRCRARGKGGVFFSGHLGNWEIMGAAVSLLGYPVSYIVTTQRNKAIERWMDDLRRGRNVGIIKTHDSPRLIIQALRDNRLLAVLSDQDAHEDGEFVDFFGRAASVPRGGAVLQQKTDAMPIFCYATGLPGGKWRVHLEEILLSNNTNTNEHVTEVLTIVTRRLEEEIRRHPDQWLWMHRRWKTRPPCEDNSDN
jgi:KDO2-lipid IV(A) lauroyltransferase